MVVSVGGPDGDTEMSASEDSNLDSSEGSDWEHSEKKRSQRRPSKRPSKGRAIRPPDSKQHDDLAAAVSFASEDDANGIWKAVQSRWNSLHARSADKRAVFPIVPSMATIEQCVQRFRNFTSIAENTWAVCAVCGEFRDRSQVCGAGCST